MALSRRDFVARSGKVGFGIALAGSVDTLLGAGPALGATDVRTGYGPLVPDPAGLLDLPRGFRYKVVSREGLPLPDGGIVPGAFDGMATFAGGRDSTFLVRNHEQGATADWPAVAAPSHTFNPAAKGGTTTLRVDHRGGLLDEYVSLAGTSRNCAGGRTPWNTWITCEETEASIGGIAHGWNFEVDPHDNDKNALPTPLRAMGRFAHEAIAVDPRTGVVYETEDATGPFGLIYRFSPNNPLGGYGSLRAGGALEAMHVAGVPDLSSAQTIGATYRVSWVAIPDPLATSVPTRKQRTVVSRSQKLEGAWWGDDACYFVASFARTTSGAAANHDGQVWRYDPRCNELTLVLVFTGGGIFDSPDNITVSPWGGVMLCEDGDGEQYVVGATEHGTAYAFARNALGDSEFAGATFSRDGKTMFVNIQSPGITFAVQGPWKRHSRS